MKNRQISPLFLSVFLILSPVLLANCKRRTVISYSPPVAKVNDEVIRKSMLDEVIQVERKKLGGILNSDQEAQLRRTALDALIAAALIRDKAKKLSLFVSEEEVEKRYQIRLNSFGSEARMNEMIQGLGLTKSLYRRKLANEVLREKVSLKLVELQSVTEEELDELIRQKQIPKIPAKAKVLCLTIQREPKRSREDAEATAKEALAKIKSGLPFDDVAKKYSDIPVEGQTINKSTAGFSTLFEIAIGQVSNILDNVDGLQICRVDERVEERTPNQEEFRKQTRMQLLRNKREKVTRKLILTLKKEAIIKEFP